MTAVINGSSPTVTFSDGTTQATAGVPLTGGNISGNLNVSGNLGVGTTSPGQNVEINSGASNVTVLAKATGANYATYRLQNSTNDYSMQIRTDQSNAWVLRDETAGGNRLLINTSGYFFLPTMPTTGGGANCTISTGEGNKFYISTSALKYKQDIRDLESIDINKFRPVRYKSKCEGDDKNKDFFGFIADEVHDAGITELIAYDSDGEVNGFQYDRLTVVLVKAIQELKAEINELKALVG